MVECQTPLRKDVFETIDRMHHRVVTEIQQSYRDEYEDIYSRDNLNCLLQGAVHSGLDGQDAEDQINVMIEERVDFIRNRQRQEMDAMGALTLDRKKEWATILAAHGE